MGVTVKELTSCCIKVRNWVSRKGKTADVEENTEQDRLDVNFNDGSLFETASGGRINGRRTFARRSGGDYQRLRKSVSYSTGSQIAFYTRNGRYRSDSLRLQRTF
jgi:hypothetical protein